MSKHVYKSQVSNPSKHDTFTDFVHSSSAWSRWCKFNYVLGDFNYTSCLLNIGHLEKDLFSFVQ